MMKNLLNVFLLFTLFGCSLFQTDQQVENYLKGLELFKIGKMNQAKPFLIQSCKQGKTAACAVLGNKVEEKELYQLSVMQGASDDSTVKLNIVAPKKQELSLLVWEGENFIAEVESSEIKKSFSDWKIVKTEITNLKLGAKYRVDIIDKDTAKIVDRRYFEPLKTTGTKLNFLVVSCLSDSYEKEAEQMWRESMEKTRPEVIFIIGDAVYADWVNNLPVKEGANPQQLWMRFRQGWNMYKLFRMSHLTPVYGTWDDHDFGKNNGGLDFQHKDAAKNTFNAFFAQDISNELPNLSPGKGVGISLKLRNQMFYFLDNRFFRASGEDKEGTHLGDEQEQWLYASLKKNPIPSYLIMGDQFFGAYHPFESYEGLHHPSFMRFLEELKKIKTKVVFISGDRHLTEIMKIEKKYLNYQTYELTSSGMFTKVYPGSFEKTPNHRGIAGADGVLNYMQVKSNVSKNFKLEVKSYTQNKKLLFSKRLNIK